MSYNFRMPNITGTEKEQLAQLRSYLYQFIPELQFALNSMTQTSAVVQTQQSSAMVPQSMSEENPEVTFAKLKSLIIKSADIVEAYYEEINKKLKGLYVAESDFGTFVEKTEQDIKTTSTYVDQKFSDVQVIITDIEDATTEINNSVIKVEADIADTQIYVNQRFSDVQSTITDVENVTTEINNSVTKVEDAISDTNAKIDGTTSMVDNLNVAIEDTTSKLEDLNSSVEDANKNIESLNIAIVEANAHIRSGILYYDDNGIPVYGLEIGQRNTVNGEEVFNKYARFVSDRLSFYDQNGNEVAYISDYKLYIRNMEITSSFRIGGFVDTVLLNGDVVTMWVGGEG